MLLTLSEKSAGSMYIACEDVWLRLSPGPDTALTQWLMGSLSLVSLLLHMKEELGHRPQVRHVDEGWGCLVAAALGEEAKVTHRPSPLSTHLYAWHFG